MFFSTSKDLLKYCNLERSTKGVCSLVVAQNQVKILDFLKGKVGFLKGKVGPSRPTV